MQLHFFRIPILDAADAAGELNRFLASRRVVSVDRELLHDGANSAWAVCVTSTGVTGDPAPAAKGGRLD